MSEITYIDDENVWQIARIREEAVVYIVGAMCHLLSFVSGSAHIFLCN